MTWVIGAAIVLVILLAAKSATGSSASHAGLSPSAREVEEIVREEIAHHPTIPASFALANADLETAGTFRTDLVNSRNEYSVGLMQINWRAHAARCREFGATGPDSLKDPRLNVNIWADIVKDLLRMAVAQEPNAGEQRQFELVRLGLGSLTTMHNPSGPTATAMLAKFRPCWDRWRAEEDSTVEEVATASVGWDAAKEATEAKGAT